MEAISFADVIDHVFFQKINEVVCADAVFAGPIDATKRRPGFESFLLGELDTLLLDDLFVL
jgi:hypothetical protein